MPDTVTPILGLTKPEIGASSNTWGNKLNGDFDILDKSVVNTAQWKITMGDGNPSSSAGPLTISRYDNTPTLVDNPISINRQTGDVTVPNNLAVNKQIYLQDGSVGVPSLSFALEAALGFFRKAASKIGFSGRLDGNGAVPAGAIMDFAMAAPPTGWLACDGQSLLVASYPDLFAAIGYTYGGSGANFSLPNAITRYRRHRDGASVSGAVGNTQASQNLTHTHPVNIASGANSVDHTHTYSGTTGTMNRNNPHSHNYSGPAVMVAGQPNTSIYGTISTQTTAPTDIAHEHTFSGTTAGASAAHTHTVTGNTGNGTADGAEARPVSLTVLTCIKT